MRFALIFPLAAGLFAGELRLGKPLSLEKPTTLDAIYANPAKYVGQMVQVKGRVTEVCQMMGCWMAVSDGSRSIRIKVNDGDLVFPKDAPGKRARAEGKLEKLELTREQAIAHARHEAEEQGRKFNAASVKGPVTIYQVAGIGAILEGE